VFENNQFFITGTLHQTRFFVIIIAFNYNRKYFFYKNEGFVFLLINIKNILINDKKKCKLSSVNNLFIQLSDS